jgi:hypothetical protein
MPTLEQVKELLESKLKRRKNGVVVRRPTARFTWKAFEIKVARFFGSERTPLSGGASRQTRSDSLHPELFVECKFRAKLPVWDLFIETQKLAKLEKKIPVVAIKKKGEDGFLFIIRPEDLQKIADIKNEYDRRK